MAVFGNVDGQETAFTVLRLRGPWGASGTAQAAEAYVRGRFGSFTDAGREGCDSLRVVSLE